MEQLKGGNKRQSNCVEGLTLQTAISIQVPLWRKQGCAASCLSPEPDGVLRDVAPVLVMAQVAVSGGHLYGGVDAICQAVNGPGIHPDGSAH